MTSTTVLWFFIATSLVYIFFHSCCWMNHEVVMPTLLDNIPYPIQLKPITMPLHKGFKKLQCIWRVLVVARQQDCQKILPACTDSDNIVLGTKKWCNEPTWCCFMAINYGNIWASSQTKMETSSRTARNHVPCSIVASKGISAEYWKDNSVKPYFYLTIHCYPSRKKEGS